MVNAVVLKTTGFRLVGSTPTLGTNPNRSTTCVIEQPELTILCAAKPLCAEYLQKP